MSEYKQIEPEKINASVDIPLNARDIFGNFQTVTSAPTVEPKKYIDQIKIYTNGSTYRLYWFDKTNKTWHYVTATA